MEKCEVCGKGIPESIGECTYCNTGIPQVYPSIPDNKNNGNI